MSDLGQLRQLETSLTAVRAVGGVVSAVSALARAQLPRAEQALAQTGAYLEWLDRVVDELAGPPIDDPAADTLTVVLGPERAFCGDLAAEVLAAAPRDAPVGLVGTRLLEAAGRAEDLDLRFGLPGPAGVDELDTVARALAGALLEATPGQMTVELLHASERPGGTVRARLLSRRRGRAAGRRDLFSSPERIAQAAARESVTGHLRAALAEALLVETRVRAAVAERARRAVEDREAELASELRVLDRELITAELTELTGAMEALVSQGVGA